MINQYNLPVADPFSVIGIVGTAKNTGKTTTLSFLIQNAYRRGLPIGVTGIGYDGEEIDTITMLPKPRLYLEKNTIVATSEKCLEITSTEFTLLEKTDIITALGSVFIVQITKPGLMVIAGPNKKSDLIKVIALIQKYKIALLFVDGSLNRITPMSVANKIIFTTGASRNTEIKFLANEMKGIQSIFQQPKTGFNLSSYNKICIFNNETKTIELLSLLDKKDAKLVASSITSNTKAVYIPGLISTKGLIHLVDSIKNCSTKIELIINSPITLLLAGEPSSTGKIIESLPEKNIKLTYSLHPLLTAVTINPFYPKEVNLHFTSAYIDKNQFKNEMKDILSVPVYNIKEDKENLLDLCIN